MFGDNAKRIINAFAKFSFTGILSMLLDQGLFAILVNYVFVFCSMKASIVISTIIARICSSIFNYCMNRSVVFKSEAGLGSFIRYYILCIIQMLASAGGVALVYGLTKGNSSIIKLSVDFLLFLVSYQIQKKWVFAEKKK